LKKFLLDEVRAEKFLEQSWKIKFGWKSLQGSGIVKFLLVSPEYLEGLDFSATFGEAEKSKVKNQRIKCEAPLVKTSGVGSFSLVTKE